jgi:hypothetical protein
MRSCTIIESDAIFFFGTKSTVGCIITKDVDIHQSSKLESPVSLIFDECGMPGNIALMSSQLCIKVAVRIPINLHSLGFTIIKSLVGIKESKSNSVSLFPETSRREIYLAPWLE